MSDRKKDHIELALSLKSLSQDKRFWYEPVVSAFNSEKLKPNFKIANKKIKFPLWVSSMTGGTKQAKLINQNLAKACKKFGLGMGLGSCRSLFESENHFSDFDIRSIMGDEQPLFGNIGIAQLEQYLLNGKIGQFTELLNKLSLDGWIVHLNPLQEWAQPEGDRYQKPPLETLTRFLDQVQFPIIVKEVGHGFGPRSLDALLSLPLAAIELAGFGGTNFTLIEQARQDESLKDKKSSLVEMAAVGQTNQDMVNIINSIVDQSKEYPLIIFSGGIHSSLDGYYFQQKCLIPSLFAQAGQFLRMALKGEVELFNYVENQIELYEVANRFLTIREENN